MKSSPRTACASLILLLSPFAWATPSESNCPSGFEKFSRSARSAPPRLRAELAEYFAHHPYQDGQFTRDHFYPRERFRQASEWSAHLQRRLAQASSREIRAIRKEFPFLVPPERPVEAYREPEIAWGFAIRDIPFMKRMVAHAAADLPNRGATVGAWLRMSERLTPDERAEIFRPLTRHYAQLDKTKRADGRLPPKRIADLVASSLADPLSSFAEADARTAYRQYLARVRSLVGTEAEWLPATQDADRMIAMFEKLQAQLQAFKRAGAELQIVVMGSTVNGRAIRGSDVDLGIFLRDRLGSRTQMSTAQLNQLKLVFQEALGDQIPVGVVSEFPVLNSFLEFGTRNNGLAVKIDADGVQFFMRPVSRLNTEGLSPPQLPSFTLPR